MNTSEARRSRASTLTWAAVLLALVVVLQIWGSAIRIGAVGISLVLVPIVLGGMLLGPLVGAGLGLAFGVVTLVAGIAGADPFTAVLFADHPVLTSLTCLVKGTAAGLVSALVYRLLRGKNTYAATFAASALAPVLNTGLFILGALAMSDTIGANFAGDRSVIYFLIIGCAGVNFLVEFALNLVLAPALFRLTEIVEKHFRR